MIIPVFLPHGGCPERCAFCDQAVSGGEPTAPARIVQAIESHLATGGSASELAFYGGTFTALARERQRACLEAARPYLLARRIGSIRLATRPDAIDEGWLAELRDRYGVATVELGAQSFNPKVLARLGRSHAPDDTDRAVATLKRLGLRVGLHLMIGCPGEDPDEDARTLERATGLRPELARIHPLLALAGTPLETSWRRGEWRPLELEEAVKRAAWLTRGLEVAGVRVIRLGLQPNELLGAAVVAGPYHPAFGDLVRGRLLRERATAALERALSTCRPSTDIPSRLAAEFRLPERISGRFRGPGGANLSWLADRFGLSSVTVAVVEDAPLYGDLEVRIYHPDRPAQRGKVEPSQRPRRVEPRHRHPESPDHAPALAWPRRAP